MCYLFQLLGKQLKSKLKMVVWLVRLSYSLRFEKMWKVFGKGVGIGLGESLYRY